MPSYPPRTLPKVRRIYCLLTVRVSLLDGGWNLPVVVLRQLPQSALLLHQTHERRSLGLGAVTHVYLLRLAQGCTALNERADLAGDRWLGADIKIN